MGDRMVGVRVRVLLGTGVSPTSAGVDTFGSLPDHGVEAVGFLPDDDAEIETFFFREDGVDFFSSAGLGILGVFSDEGVVDAFDFF